MAYLPYKLQQGQPTLGDGGGGYSGTPSGPGSLSSPVNAGAPKQGTGFTDLQTYFGLNRPATQGMADSLYGDASQQQSAYSGARDALGSDYQGAVNAGIANPTQAPGTGAYQDSGTARPNMSNQYSGPSSLYGYDPSRYANVLRMASAADTNSQLLNDQSGLQSLLSQKYGNGSYTSGEQGLDAFLAGAAAAGRPNTYGGNVSDFNSFTSNEDSLAANAPGKVSPWQPPAFANDQARNPVSAPIAFPTQAPTYGPSQTPGGGMDQPTYGSDQSPGGGLDQPTYGPDVPPNALRASRGLYRSKFGLGG